MNKQPTKTPPPVCIFLTAKEVAAMLGVSLATVYNWADSDCFPAPVQLGQMRATGRAGRIAWLRTEVEEWVAQLVAQPRDVRRRSAPLAAMPSA